ncbi:MAG TPA: universal stress protein [Pyrinomonadaceae bacterium]|nr:universal stress protein [Pyrinomonadaceae bacterium]
MGEKMKVLVAYDGSDCADEALFDLPRAGLPHDAEALVFSVGEVVLPAPPPSSYEITAQAFASRRVGTAVVQAQAHSMRAIGEARETAERACESLRSAFPGWDVRAEAVAGMPAWAIIERAREWPADLIVVGSHGRTALGRLIMGSVSHKVAAEANTSVRVVRCDDDNTRDDSPVRLLIGFDGSPPSCAAVRAVARRQWPAGTTALLVVACEPSGAPVEAGIIPSAPFRSHSAGVVTPESLRAAVETAEEDLSAAAGLHVTCKIREGGAKGVILEEAVRLGADCIFVGSRGLSGRVERFLLGSVSDALVKGAPCSVEVVRG